MEVIKTIDGREIKFSIHKGDITQLNCDAIVNAAHEALLGGGGVDGAIHRAAGQELVEFCRTLPQVTSGVRCPEGEAKITHGYNLPAKYVVHTVAPKFVGGIISRVFGSAESKKYFVGGGRTISTNLEDNLEEQDPALQACYVNSLSLANSYNCESIAFPSLGTGGHAYPIELAAPVAVRTVRDAIVAAPNINRVIFVTFSEYDEDIYKRAFNLLL